MAISRGFYEDFTSKGDANLFPVAAFYFTKSEVQKVNSFVLKTDVKVV